MVLDGAIPMDQIQAVANAIVQNEIKGLKPEQLSWEGLKTPHHSAFIDIDPAHHHASSSHSSHVGMAPQSSTISHFNFLSSVTSQPEQAVPLPSAEPATSFAQPALTYATGNLPGHCYLHGRSKSFFETPPHLSLANFPNSAFAEDGNDQEVGNKGDIVTPVAPSWNGIILLFKRNCFLDVMPK